MRRYFLLGAAVVALAIPAVALAAVNLQTAHVGTTCEHGGVFHFVANGVDGGKGALTANFSDGGSVAGLATVKFNQGTNHWTIEGFGTLTDASATVGTKLVLSDYTCYEKKEK